MSRLLLGLFGLAFGIVCMAGSASAADYAIPARRQVAQISYIDRGPNPYCGPRCGCPIPFAVRHRSLVQYYPSSLDPRTKPDVPYFRYGSVRTYVRYVDPKDPDRVLTY